MTTRAKYVADQIINSIQLVDASTGKNKGVPQEEQDRVRKAVDAFMPLYEAMLAFVVSDVTVAVLQQLAKERAS